VAQEARTVVQPPPDGLPQLCHAVGERTAYAASGTARAWVLQPTNAQKLGQVSARGWVHGARSCWPRSQTLDHLAAQRKWASQRAFDCSSSVAFWPQGQFNDCTQETQLGAPSNVSQFETPIVLAVGEPLDVAKLRRGDYNARPRERAREH
jgi:hypothetical protein